MKAHEIIEWVYINAHLYYKENKEMADCLKILVLSNYYKKCALCDMLEISKERMEYLAGRAWYLLEIDEDFTYCAHNVYNNLNYEMKIKAYC